MAEKPSHKSQGRTCVYCRSDLGRLPYHRIRYGSHMIPANLDLINHVQKKNPFNREGREYAMTRRHQDGSIDARLV
jgi:hypothetical protein